MVSEYRVTPEHHCLNLPRGNQAVVWAQRKGGVLELQINASSNLLVLSRNAQPFGEGTH